GDALPSAAMLEGQCRPGFEVLLERVHVEPVVALDDEQRAQIAALDGCAERRDQHVAVVPAADAAADAKADRPRGHLDERLDHVAHASPDAYGVQEILIHRHRAAVRLALRSNDGKGEAMAVGLRLKFAGSASEQYDA